MAILLIRYQVCWLLVSDDGEDGGYAAGSWGGRVVMLQVVGVVVFSSPDFPAIITPQLLSVLCSRGKLV